MVAKLIASIALLGLTCVGCGGPPPPDPNVAALIDVGQGKPVKDRCDQAPDLDFRNQVVGAAPFTGPSTVEKGSLVLPVDPGGWRNLGYGLRQQIIAIIDCGDAGPGKYHTTIYVRGPDGTNIMTVSTPVLMGWREEGLAALDRSGLRADEVPRDAAIATPSPVDPGAAGQ